MSKHLVLFWLVVLPLGGVLAQSNCHFQLRGVVKDEDTQSPIPFASVMVKEIATGTTTDENGRFIIPNLCRQTYTLEISHIECKKHAEQLVIEDNTEGVFFLSHDEKLLKSVEVRDKRVALEATQSNASITGEDLRAAQGQLLADVLKTMAGVNTLNTGSNISKPVIQGLHSDRVLILNNGVRQEGQQWGLDHAPEIDPFIADKITVIKGAAGVRYGVGAIGGVILVEPRPLRDTLGMGGKISLVGFSNGRQGVVSSMLEGKLPSGLAWRVQGTTKRGGTQHTPQYNLQNTGVEEINGSLMLGYRLNKTRFELFYAHFYSKIAISVIRPTCSTLLSAADRSEIRLFLTLLKDPRSVSTTIF
jgi:iron complex outermembrane recepter protein